MSATNHQDRLTNYSNNNTTKGEEFRSSRSGSRQAILNNSDTQWIISHADELRRLPEPGVEWSWANVGLSNSLLQQLNNRGLIERISRDDREWRTKSKTHKAILEYSE